jgi:hypothetical protein
MIAFKIISRAMQFRSMENIVYLTTVDLRSYVALELGSAAT